MEYGTRGLTDYVDLSLWQPGMIRRQLHAPQLRRFCVRTIDAGIAGIDATLVGYVDPLPRRCGGRQPNTYTAVAFFAGVAVTIEAGACDSCRRRGVYSSPAGLRTIIRALRPREPSTP